MFNDSPPGNGHRDNGRDGLLAFLDPEKATTRNADDRLQTAVTNEVIDQVNREFPPGVLQAPTGAERQQVLERIHILVGAAYRRNGVTPGFGAEQELAADLGRRLMGFGFLDLLLPPARSDISEIAVYSHGLVQVMKKGSVRWETVPGLLPDAGEINRVLDRLLGPQNKSLNETNPSVNAKLPATPANPGGGRVKALHPVIAPPGRNPSLNIRLFEQKPVLPEWLLERGVMSAEMMELLCRAMEQGYRTLITGGTRTGKTTLLSALCNFLPEGWRIVKIEDPEEIWIDRPTVQAVEARPAQIGAGVQSYSLRDGVDDALRMSPDYLIVGEVRDGHAAQSLFRAMMTGHSGACTFHADNPREAVERLANIVCSDTGSRAEDVKGTIAGAIDLLVQIGIRDEVRRVTAIANVAKRLRNGEVGFDPIYRFDFNAPSHAPRWERAGELAPRIEAEMSF
ncbi:MAG: ATPase, T2SS/T4P/T4SS family [Chloroflexota bacterium]